MDKNAIKKYAVWARRELISRVSQKALQYGISDVDIVAASAPSVNGVVLSADEMTQRKALIVQIEAKGYKQVMEEVAYTWFNRFIALRFMEVNGYLPSRVRVFTDDNNAFKPQILAEAINLELDGLDMDKVYALKDANNDDALFKYLIITQCNALNPILPGMFQRISDYTELLFPDNLLREGSTIQRLISDIPEDNWTEQVEVLGWMYQYYISEKHDQIVSINQGAVKKEDIPAATQLFTTDWVVRYMVDNSLGRYWIERHPESTLAEKLQFFVKPKNGEIAYIQEMVSPQEMTFFDPCMGSGHILVYAFDVLMEIYRECGYTDREAVSEIVQNNLFGLDIDDRCSQLAYFAVMMKARSYDRRFLTRGINPHVLAIRESNTLSTFTHKCFMTNKVNNELGEYLIDLFCDAKEIGSLIIAKPADYDEFQKYLDARAEECALNIELSLWLADEKPLMEQLAEQAKILSRKYAVVCTNPPYMGKMDGKLKDYVLNNFKDYSGDLFSVFMFHNFAFCQEHGYSAFMTPFVWMFIKTYEVLRNYIIQFKSIQSLIQMEYSAYEEATVPICSFVLCNNACSQHSLCFRLSEFKGGMEVQKQKILEAIADPKNCGYFYEAMQTDFLKIPGTPIAYWVSSQMCNAFSQDHLADYAQCCTGMQTGNNDKYVRNWFEVNIHDTTIYSPAGRFKKYNCGGESRKWYGNHRNVVLWGDSGSSIRAEKSSVIRNESYYFNEGISWKRIGSSVFYLRYLPSGFIFDQAGDSMFMRKPEYLHYILAFVNSKVAVAAFEFIAPTMNLTAGNMNKLPIIYAPNTEIDEMVKQNIDLAKEDWDSFESSWDFSYHPYVKIYHRRYIREASKEWEQSCDARISLVKMNEEKINAYFINLYGLEEELDPNLRDEEITISRANIKRDIKSLISYAVGCMFGRYSLDIPGLAYAGGEWDDSKYVTFTADKDGIIPICDDEYFADDIVGRFIRFIELVFGKDTLQENLRFIADALGGNGQPKEVIRNYFLNDFYADHLKVYQKRPIYWLFDSGKKNGFKALVYMHRYQPDTIARMRTDYVHEQQARYRTAIADLEQRIASASTAERVKLSKRLKALQEQAAEIQGYEEKIHHLADQYIAIDLDDGVKKNYAIFGDVLAKIK